MISALLHILATKFFELARTPGFLPKLRALFIGRAPASSIAGLVIGAVIFAGAAWFEVRGEAVAWDVVTSIALSFIFGGRAVRRRRKRVEPRRPGDTETKP